MNDLDIFEELRPEVEPLTPAQVDTLRAHLFHGAALPDRTAAVADERIDDGAHDVHELPLSDLTARRRGRRTWLVGVAAAIVALVGVAGLWALAASPSKDAPGQAQQPDTLPVTVPAADPAALGLFPHGGRDGALTAGYASPVDVVAAYLNELTDPNRLPAGFAITATIAESEPVTTVDADHASVTVILQTDGDSGDARVAVQRIGTNPDVWQVTSATVIADELTDVTLDAGVVTGSIAPAAGGTTTLYAYDLVTGDMLDTAALATAPAADDRTPAAPTLFSLDVGDHEQVGLRYWNTVVPAGAYAYANFSDRAVSATSPRPAPSTTTGSTLAESSATSTTMPHTALNTAMEADGVVLVVNGSGVAGLGGSLTSAIEDSGYAVRPPTNATEPVAESIVYFRSDAPASAVALLPPAIPVIRGEELSSQQIPVAPSDDLAGADVIIVLGADLADAPWSSAPSPLVSDNPGVLLVLDGSGTPDGQERTKAEIQRLESTSVEVVDGGTAAQPVEQSILMPLGPSTRWTFAVAELAGIGGFDTWTPTLFTGDLPANVTAVLVVGP